MKKTLQTKEMQAIISVRIDSKTSRRMTNVARRLKSSKSCVMRLALARILDEADKGTIVLLPINQEF